MAARTCWKCGTYTHMTGHGDPALGPISRGPGGTRVVLLMRAYRCDQCSVMSLGLLQTDLDRLNRPGMAEAVMDQADDLVWLPRKGVGRSFEDVPTNIAEAANEAYECLSIGARRAAVQLARSVVEATAKEKQVTTGRLVDKIGEMYKRGMVREHVREAAHEIRYLGNEMAHGDFVTSVTREEAEEVLELMSEVLNEVFQSPARVDRRRQARLAKSATP